MNPLIGTIMLIVGYLGLLVWAWCRREPDESGWRDLRWWVVVLVVTQVALYVWF
jgi:hypothetical protein